MTTHRRYVFEYPKPWTGGGYDLVRSTLLHACERFWWFNEPEVQGEPFGRLIFGFTVSARDQWWAHKRAMKLATDCYYTVGMTEKDVPQPMWESLEPHTNRGRYRIPG